MGAQRLGERTAAASPVEDAVEGGPVLDGEMVPPVADAPWSGVELG